MPDQVLFVMPSFRGRSASIDARWIPAAQLAASMGRLLAPAIVLTPYGLHTPEEIETWAVREGSTSSPIGLAVRKLPRPARMLLGDLRDWRRARSMRRLAKGVNGPFGLVVQFHRRFQDCGAILARRVDAPFVLRVEALEVREQAAWGYRRVGWTGVVERIGEGRVIRRADLVASVSDVVDGQLAELGIPPERRVVIPNGVDPRLFAPGEPSQQLRRANGLDGRFVVGWMGGFRPFHGLELVPEIARGLRDRVPEAALCLVGTGSLRRQVAEQVEGLGDTVRLLDPVPHHEVPRWLRSFDVCLLLATPGPFHYSPLKLYEYLGCGRPVVAADVGEVPCVVSDGRDGLVVPPGDPDAVVDAIERLSRNPDLRARLGAEARRTAERSGSWDARAEVLIQALEDRGLLQKGRGARAPG